MTFLFLRRETAHADGEWADAMVAGVVRVSQLELVGDNMVKEEAVPELSACQDLSSKVLEKTLECQVFGCLVWLLVEFLPDGGQEGLVIPCEATEAQQLAQQGLQQLLVWKIFCPLFRAALKQRVNQRIFNYCKCACAYQN